ncbi:hypothetical protein BDW02DRAFT_167902 [Decorospora gaudefroyi]|uniref:Uncharacterized protein n=1 Tax=Decorospora gaudefroyi TaxID=184978 RepID=A0A6A5JX78_9PLEO|nr:hypothetical protein BDW02DRAFT_167902 [Decorospora gaudefroyi]
MGPPLVQPPPRNLAPLPNQRLRQHSWSPRYDDYGECCVSLPPLRLDRGLADVIVGPVLDLGLWR